MERYPGEIIDNTFAFTELKYKDSRGKIRNFQVYVRLVKEMRLVVEANWNVLEDVGLPFKPKYFEGAPLPDVCYAQYWTEYGAIDGKTTRSAPKYTERKNIGKKNERNVLEQALETAFSLYKKKKKESVKTDIPQDAVNPMVHPMLADTKEKPVEYPIYGQVKLDGNRCLAFLNQQKKVVLYTRGLKLWPMSQPIVRVMDVLLPILLELADGNRSIYFDGELYIHGRSLQEISKMRSESYTGPISYNIFDCFYLSGSSPFSERLATLQSIAFEPPLELVLTKLLKNEKEEDAFFQKALSEKYEGIMLRVPVGEYKYSTTKFSTRSRYLLKRKPLFDSEFEVVGFDEGKKGKDVGAVIWICKTASNKTFHVSPNLTYAKRRELYTDCLKNFETRYKARMMKVEYQGLSDDGIPLRAKAIDFRDFD